MITCNYCQNEATIFLTQVIGTSLKKISLCQSCSENPEIIKKEGLEQMLDTPIPAPTPISQPKPETGPSCSCGFTASDLSRTGRLGCSECYFTFESLLTDRITSIHRGSEHKGKQVESVIQEERIRHKLEQTERALSDAIANEQFEKAAQLRDELTTLKEKLSQ